MSAGADEAKLHAISSMATRLVLAELASAGAVDAGLHELQIESVGGVDAEQRIASGEAFELVFLAQGALRRLADGGHVLADTVTPLMLSQTAAAVRADPADAAAPAARPESFAFADAEGMRAALQGAERIGYSTGPSGTALVAMIERWGLSAELGERLVQARPGVPVARSLAEGEVDLGFQQLSELVGQPGIRILGVLPPDCAIDTVFSGAVVSTAPDPGAARAVLEYFASCEAAPILAAHAFAAAPSAAS